MDQAFQTFAAVLGISLVWLACPPLPQAGSGRSAVPQTQAAHDQTSSSQPQSLGDLSRKQKQNGPETQPGSSTAPAEPHVYTEDNTASPRVDASQATKRGAEAPPANAEAKAPALPGGSSPSKTKASIVLFGLEKSKITRPGSSTVNWTVQNKSDHSAEFTLTYFVSGPCNYKHEQSEKVPLGQGEGYGDNMLASAVFLENDCTGEYYFELRISSGGQVLDSAYTRAIVF